MMSVNIGKVSDQQVKMNGWLVGSFIKDSDFNDKNVEICYKVLKEETFADRLHKHPKGKEYIIIISGELTIQVGTEIVNLKSGDYITIPANTPDKIEKIINEVSLICVRYPSVPNNKVFLD